jgi:dTDP-4-amino-4,6-dideoxygalactose transaminase
MEIPFINITAQHKPIKDEILTAISNVIDHSQFILGDEVVEFERQFAELCGVRYAIGVNSGTDALILALKSVGIGPGNEVITVPNSFITSTSCITFLGATPVFVDVRDDYNINPSKIEQAITQRTRAIIPVHLTGRPSDMDEILKISKSYNLFVIEDCAQAVTAEYKGRRVGSFGDMGTFSFFFSHHISTIEGGMIVTNNEEYNEIAKALRVFGWARGLKKYEDNY